ncbi:MAG: DNRLRE domain-containing protein, partial [Lachnospiraceae bacterium]|nr:DNRLRE domain-containing protein [Lachnospiraceae bacterium]
MHQKTKKLSKILLCFALVLVMLTQSVTPVIYAKPEDKGRQEEATEEGTEEIPEEELQAEEEPERVILHEVEKNRGEYSKEYLLSDNSRSVIVYPDKVHYEDENGILLEIDNSLTRTQDGYENGNNSYDVLITDNDEGQGKVIYREDDYEIAWQMIELSDAENSETQENISAPETVIHGKEKDKPEKKHLKDKADKKNKGKKKVHKPKLSGKVEDVEAQMPVKEEGIHVPEQSKVVFDGYKNDVSVEYQPAGDGIKENIILSGKESGNEYVFELKLAGLKARLNDYNEIEFYDEKTDEVKYYFPAPFMIDNEGEVSYDARYEIIACESEEDIVNEDATEETPGESGEEPAEEAVSGNKVQSKDTETPEELPAEAGEDISEDVSEESSEEVSEEPTEGPSEENSEEVTEEASEENSGGESEEPTEESEEEASEEESEEISEEPSEESTEEESEEISGEIITEDVIVTEEADAIYIKIVLDEEWLADAAYPVIVDPVLKQYRAKNLLDYGSVASNNTLYETLYVGKNSGNTYRSFVKFDLPGMEPQSIVSEALLYLGGTYDSSNKHYIQAHMAEGEWYHKAEDKTGAFLSWNTQPTRGDLLDYTVYAGYFNITKAVRQWLSGEASNDGIVFSAYNENTNKRETIKLKDSGSSPYLKITYRSAVGLEGYWGTHSTGAGTAGAGYINDYTGALTVQNAGVVSAGGRMPLGISHYYNSNNAQDGNGWHLNYEQTIKVPVDTADTSVYPYVYTDADGTEHYFKKSEVTFQENGESKTRSGYYDVPAARDEDGLKLYIVPVTDAKLRDKYPLKLIDKSASVVKYFDTMGRLAMITDSNQYENASNSGTKEKNAITIAYESYGEPASYEHFDNASDAAKKFYDVCRVSGMNATKAEYVQALTELENCMEVLKHDVYVTSDYKTGKEINSALKAISSLADLTGTASMDTSKTKSGEIKTALSDAKTRALTLKDASCMRIASVTDAVGNKAEITYDGNGLISSISDPTYADDKRNTYTYDAEGNLTQILFANEKKAFYTYGKDHLMTSQRDHDGYQVMYTYRTADNRIVKVEESHSGTPGQTFGITYNTDNTTTFRFSGVDDAYGNADDIENIHVFDEQGRAICIYSKKVGEDKVIGATACTYENAVTSDGTEDTAKRNKIKDTAVVGMHTNNLLVNHSFEYSDSNWTMYKNESETPASGALSSRSTTRHYIGGYSAYVNLTKVKNASSGFKQTAKVSAGTYTFSGYVRTVGIANAEVYLKVKDASGNIYTSNRISKETDAAFDNGWQRLEVTFDVKTAGKVTVYLEAECKEGAGSGNAAFDCVQLEEGAVANDYNILEDGSFELTESVLPYQATNYTASSVAVADELVSGGIDGGKCYHITGEPGKDKFLKLKTKLGTGKGSYVLSGWVKTDTTPVRSGRDFKVYAYHKEETDGVVTKELKLSHNINAYSEGWRYFCMIVPADTWSDTTFTIRFFDNIGDLYIDGLSLTRNDVQTKKYNSEGKVVSSYTTQKSTAYEYDGYGRTKKQTSPTGLVNTYTYSKSNEVTKVTSNLGPDQYMKYDKYGNLLSTEIYDPDATTKPTMYSETAYTSDGNFVKSETDGLGNVTTYEYDTYTGLLLKTIYPERTGKEDFEVVYTYDEEDRLTLVKKNERTVGFEYGEFDDLTAILHNGFAYEYTYDKFGNLLSVSIAGKVLYTNEYAPNNGSLVKRTYADGAYTTTVYDEYGRVTESGLNDVIVNKYVYNNDGYVARQTDVLGNETTTIDYNDSGQVVRSEVYEGDSTASDDLQSRMQFTYNVAGAPTVISYQEPGKDIETYEFTYAKDGLLTKSVAPDKSYKEISYDSLRRPAKYIFTPKSGVSGSKKLYSSMTYL